MIVENTEGLRVVCNMDLQLCSGNILQNGGGPNISAVRKRVTSVGPDLWSLFSSCDGLNSF